MNAPRVATDTELAVTLLRQAARLDHLPGDAKAALDMALARLLDPRPDLGARLRRELQTGPVYCVGPAHRERFAGRWIAPVAARDLLLDKLVGGTQVSALQRAGASALASAIGCAGRTGSAVVMVRREVR